MLRLLRCFFERPSTTHRPGVISRMPSRMVLEELEGRLLLNSHPAGSVPHHIHPHLAIFVDGQNFTIPSNIGSSIGTPNENAHTHSSDGILHYNEETPTFRNLDEFFATWGGIFTSSQLKLPTAYNASGQATQFLERTVDATHTIRFLVNGAPSTDFQLYEPEDGDQIVISYETIPATGAPRLEPINNVTMASNAGASAPSASFYVPLDGFDPDGDSVTYSATISPNNSQLTVQVLPPTTASGTNPILRLNVSGTDIDGLPFTGTLTFELFRDIAPVTVDRILQLANQNFYNGLTFHRILNDFMAQGGDPNGNGTGGSGTKFSDEFSAQATFNGFAQLAMANSGDDSNDSQFFITDSNLSLVAGTASPNEKPPQSLNFNHTIFGQLISGFDTFNKLMLTPVGVNPSTGEQSLPQNLVTINSATGTTDTQHAMLRVTAPHDFTGSGTVTVTATSQGGTATRSFEVAVVADTVNDRPFLGSIPALATTVNTAVSFVVPATDLEGDTLVIEAGDPTNPANQPANATVSINQTTRKVTVTPANGFQGTLTLKVGVRDGTDRSQQAGFTQDDFDTQVISIAVAVNSAPTADSQNSSTAFGASKQITLTGSDGDAPAEQTLSFRVQTLPTNGAVTDSAGNPVSAGQTLPTANVNYTPFPGFSGADSFTFVVQDSGGTANGGVNTSSPATVSVTVAPNQAPTASPQTTGTTFGIAKSITLTGEDGDAGVTQTLTFRVQSLPANGTLTNSAGNPITTGTALPSAQVAYTPAAGFAGTDTFTFDVQDNGGTTNGGQNTSAPATVSISVAANQRPTATAQTVAAERGETKTITLAGDDGDTSVTQTLSFRIQSLPAHGTVRDSLGNTVTVGATLPSAVVTYRANANFNGADPFTFDVKDNGGTTGGGLDTSAPATVTVNVSAQSHDFEGTASVKLHGRVLRIEGDKQANLIDLALSTDGEQIEVTINDDEPEVFDLADVDRIKIHAHEGDDEVSIDSEITLQAYIRAGKGNDTVAAGGGDTTMRGGIGDDDLTGGDGNDFIRGRKGNDSVDGGDGDDIVRGGRGDDSTLGGAGDDHILAFLGTDRVDAGTGDDKVDCGGNTGHTIVPGGDGDVVKHCGAADTSNNEANSSRLAALMSFIDPEDEEEQINDVDSDVHEELV